MPWDQSGKYFLGMAEDKVAAIAVYEATPGDKILLELRLITLQLWRRNVGKAYCGGPTRGYKPVVVGEKFVTYDDDINIVEQTLFSCIWFWECCAFVT